MTRVAITKSELDSLAESIGAKVERRVPLTIDEMKEVVDGIELPNLQAASVNPTTSQQVVEPDQAHNGLSSVTVGAISPVRTSADLITANQQVQVPAGWYAVAAFKDVKTMTLPTSTSTTATGTNKATIGRSTSTRYINIPTGYNLSAARYTISGIPDATTSSSSDSYYHDTVSGRKWTKSYSVSCTSSGYLTASSLYDNSDDYDAVPSGTTVTPTESAQTVGGADTMMEGAVTVNAIPSNYVGSGITQRTSSDLTASGATVTAPAGYYSSAASKTLDSVQPYVGVTGNSFYTENNVRKYHFCPSVEVNTSEGDTPGYFADGVELFGDYVVYNAVPANTTIMPSTSSQTVGGANYMMEGAVTVAAMPSGSVSASATKGTVSNHAISVTPTATIGTAGYLAAGSTNGTAVSVSASELVSGTVAISASGNTDVTNYATASVAAGSATASATKGSVSNHSVTVTPSVTRTAGWVTAGSANGTAVSVSASELVSGTYTVDSSGTKDVTNYASASIPAGTAGTPSASKGAVSNHSVSVTPSVTNSTGWITGGTKTGTAVTVSASELVSGNLAITENGTNIDCSNYATCSVSVSGGGGSSVQVDTAYSEFLSTASSTLVFQNLAGEPTSFLVYIDDNISTGTPAKVAAVVFDGTTLHGQTITNTSNAQVSADTGFTKSYSNGTLTIVASSAQFVSGEWLMVYTYGGTSACIDAKDVQVGSGATSITFTGLEDEPLYWSCIFKSNFSTSSGYQRVIFVGGWDSNQEICGMSMDSSARCSFDNWTATYSNGSLTISSSGTNAGGYFHQPGYYQLTYAIDATGNYQSKTVTPTESQQIVQADSGYDALKKVTVNAIPNTYVQPTSTVGATTYRASTSSQTIQAGTYHSAAATIAAVTATNLEAGNIKSGTTITISNGQSNLWSVTGTYSGGGGGGGSVNVATTTWSNNSTSTVSHQFTGLSGTPKAAFLRCTSQLTRSSSNTYYYIADIVWDGTDAWGNYHLRSNGSFNNVAKDAASGFNVTTGTNSITFSSDASSRSSAPGSFYNGTYELTYVY